jgi:hypothetical protein
VARTFQDALSIAEDYLASTGGHEVMVIGGGKVYAETIHLWDRLYLTVVKGKFKGSTYFPVRELLRQTWRPACEPEMHPSDEKNPYSHSFHIIERVREAVPRSSKLVAYELTPGCADPKNALEELDLAAILARGTMGS